VHTHRSHHCANHGPIRVGGVVLAWDGAAWPWDLEHGDDSFLGDAAAADDECPGDRVLALGHSLTFTPASARWRSMRAMWGLL